MFFYFRKNKFSFSQNITPTKKKNEIHNIFEINKQIHKNKYIISHNLSYSGSNPGGPEDPRNYIIYMIIPLAYGLYFRKTK